MDSSEDGSHKEMAAINYGTAGGEVKEQQDAKSKKCAIIEVIILVVTLVFVWMLLLLPIIFYHLPDEVFTRKVRVHTTQVE